MKKCTIVIAVLAGYFIIAWGQSADNDNDWSLTSVISYAGADLEPDHPAITAPTSVWFMDTPSNQSITNVSQPVAVTTKNDTDITNGRNAPDDDSEYYSETSDDEYYSDDPILVAPSNDTITHQPEVKTDVSSRNSSSKGPADVEQNQGEDKPKIHEVGKMLASNLPVDNSNFRKAFEYFEASWKRSTFNGTGKPDSLKGNGTKMSSKIWQRPKVGSNQMNVNVNKWQHHMIGSSPINRFNEWSFKKKANRHWNNRFDINESKSGMVVDGIPDILNGNDQSEGTGHSASPGSSSLIGSTFEQGLSANRNNRNWNRVTVPSLLSGHGSMERSSTYNDPYSTRPPFMTSPVYNRFDNDVFRPFPFSARDEQRFPEFHTASMESSQQKPFIPGGTFRLESSDISPSPAHPGPRRRKRKRKRKKEGSRQHERAPHDNENLPSPHYHPFISGLTGNDGIAQRHSNFGFQNHPAPGSSYAHQTPFSFNFRSPVFLHHDHLNLDPLPPNRGHSNEDHPPTDFGQHSHPMMAPPALPIVAPPTNGLPPIPIPMQALNQFPLFIPTEQAMGNGNRHLTHVNRGVVTYMMDRVRRCKYPSILSFLNPNHCQTRNKKFIHGG